MLPNQRIDRPTSSLLDRLIGNHDGADVAVRFARSQAAGEETSAMASSIVPSSNATITRRQQRKQIGILRTQIQRDLLALFATRRLSEDTDLEAWPLVRNSVLNYGIPDLSGSTGSSINTGKLQQELTSVIKSFEPRLRPDTLTVTCRVNEFSIGDLTVDIEALFGPADGLETFAMGIAINLGSGQCHATDPSQIRRAG
ncbi:Gene 25-like lysozyme [Rubripirellula lacrimiformis]|uniref:Gene 25-like lysozyme n=1 Tax=Rubripirellula lacrimiformis TaxID=1930273 RepID=A0A517NAC7_9BACT|nr:GPW/gp25 family protein [Rubripirellula lacrimiformis]QDT03968.1 Gene 25-like lysozyme [Rubripirellula lacrimiformis]